MRLQKVLISAVMVLAVDSSQAQTPADQHGYVMGGMGTVYVRADCSNTRECNAWDFALHAGAGAWVPWSLAGGRLAVELRAFDLGKTRLGNPALTAELSHNAVSLGGAWHRPITPSVSVAVGAGLARMSTRLAGMPAGGGLVTGVDRYLSGYAVLGLQHKLNGGATLDAQALFSRARYANGLLDLGRGQLGVVMLGVTQRF